MCRVIKENTVKQLILLKEERNRDKETSRQAGTQGDITQVVISYCLCGTGERKKNEALAKDQEDTKTGFLHDKEGPYLASESNLIYKITSVRIALATIEEALLVIY